MLVAESKFSRFYSESVMEVGAEILNYDYFYKLMKI